MTAPHPDPGPGLVADVGVALGPLELDAHLGAGPGEVVAVMGPNGAGKSTLLRALVGLTPLDHGSIALDGEVLDDPDSGRFVPPDRRRVGVVFQDLVLFPHLTAVDNVAFGLREAGRDRAGAQRTAAAWLDRVGLGDVAERPAPQLSGGQAQRVALARALAPEPRLVLLDEPLTALDAATRAEVRRDLGRHLRDLAVPAVVVTHDAVDAVALADRVVVLEAGRVVQTGALAELSSRPRTRYVADLLGLNLLAGEARGTTVALAGGQDLVVADPARGPVLAVVRPSAVSLHRSEPAGSARNRWPGTVAELELAGERVRVRVHGPVPLVAEVTPAAVAELDLREGADVWTSVKATEIDAYPA